MLTKIRFDQPYDVTPGGHDGTKVAFPFTVERPGVGARKSDITQHRVIVDISDTLSSSWDFGRSSDTVAELAPTLFEYAREAVIEKLIDDKLSESESLRIIVPYKDKYPFDPAKLTQPAGVTLEIDLEESRRQRRLQKKRPIGFDVNRKREDT